MHASAHGGFSQLAEPNSCQFYLFFPQLSVLHACKKGEPGPRMLVQVTFLTASLLSTIGYNSHAVVL